MLSSRLFAQLLSAASVSAALLLVGAGSGLAADPTIEATGTSLANYAWTPATAAVESGGSVSFKNPTASFHALAWESGPETPSCTGTPSGGQANWSGSCSFAQGGTFKFYCPVHPAQMKGTITVSGSAAPVVTTGSAGSISETEATLNGTVNPSEQATGYLFEYGPTTAYGQKTSEASAGSGTSPVPASVTVSGLSPATTYHFRLVAKNTTGTSYGTDRSFKTVEPVEPPPSFEPPPAVEPPPTVEPPPASTGSPPPPAVLPAPAAAPEPPDTRITLKPRARTRDRTPTVRFAATVAGASYRCSVDGKPFKACRSPFTAPPLKPGRHTIRIAASAGGAPDPTPAACSFRVLAPRK